MLHSVPFCYRRLIGSSFRGHILDLVSHRGIVNGQNGSVEYYLGADTVSLKSPTQTTIGHLAKTFSGNNLQKKDPSHLLPLLAFLVLIGSGISADLGNQLRRLYITYEARTTLRGAGKLS